VAAAFGDQLDDLGDDGVEMLVEFDVGDTVDLPPDAAKPPVAALVVLGVESTTVPRHVIDLDRPANVGECPVGMDDRSVREADGLLANEAGDPRLLERADDAMFET
jgi:hypothetical protein